MSAYPLLTASILIECGPRNRFTGGYVVAGLEVAWASCPCSRAGDARATTCAMRKKSTQYWGNHIVLTGLKNEGTLNA